MFMKAKVDKKPMKRKHYNIFYTFNAKFPYFYLWV